MKKLSREIIQIENQFYILATSPRVDDQTRVLKEGDTFAVFDHNGDIKSLGLGEQGIFHEGTRFLSELELRLAGEAPLLLSSTVKQDNMLLSINLTNPDVRENEELKVLRGAIHIFRSKFLWQGACYEQLRISNFGLNRVALSFSWQYAADFADIFEVRGIARTKRGRLLEPTMEKGAIVLGYEGLDGRRKYTRLEFSPAPKTMTASDARFDLRLESKGEATFFFSVHCFPDQPVASSGTYAMASVQARRKLEHAQSGDCRIHTSNVQFNDWINRSLSDLHMMVTKTIHGPYPYAGVPWFSTPFGRDGIITALEWLWVNPEIAKGVLSYLTATQAGEKSDERDADPGKILHETRKGEMAALGEIPFGLYYGSVDSTALFVILAGAYYRRTGDIGFAESIWKNIAAALDWNERFGDVDGDGFVEYARHSPKGLVHQGWKDSHDSVFHADGTPAEGPIALCEVQGYLYAARREAAMIAGALGKRDVERELSKNAEALKEKFENVFWDERLSTYVLALDGKKRPCMIRSSNPGHCLFTRIVSPERARRVAEGLMSPEFFSGWGIRTLASSESRYNPMSYHNGSIWPHDNALIAQGLSFYGLKAQVLRILSGLFDSTLFFDLHRLPELFCGFHRRSGEGPTLYPVACSPQAWSAGAVLMLLQACLGLSIDAAGARIRFEYPVLPPFLRDVEVKNFRVGSTFIDFHLEWHPEDVGIRVTRREGPLTVEIVK